MNKSLVKLATDFGPLLVFFTVYYRSDKSLVTAIPPLIIATLIAVVIVYFLEKKIPYVPLVGAVIISVFGGKIIFNKNLLKVFLQKSIRLEKIGWDKLMYRWIAFFIFLAILNEAVWRTQSEEFWVNFKVWGILPLTFIFTAFQVPLIQKYKKNEG